jgi:hypothetical protein
VRFEAPENKAVAQHKALSKTSSKRSSPKRSAKKLAGPRQPRTNIGNRRREASSTTAGDETVTIDRRRGQRREDGDNPVADDASAAGKLERRQKVNRRRQIDPTTCERDYTEQEVEFMNALDDYKRKSGRMFPTCSEVLEVIRSLGYVKVSAAESAALAVGGTGTTSAKPMPSDWSQPMQTLQPSGLDATTPMQSLTS